MQLGLGAIAEQLTHYVFAEFFKREHKLVYFRHFLDSIRLRSTVCSTASLDVGRDGQIYTAQQSAALRFD